MAPASTASMIDPNGKEGWVRGKYRTAISAS
jgi:hypothetical protein